MLAEGAERRRLAMCPLLCRDPRLREAWTVLPVAEPTRNPPAVDAGAVESFLVTDTKDFHETKRRLLWVPQEGRRCPRRGAQGTKPRDCGLWTAL